MKLFSLALIIFGLTFYSCSKKTDGGAPSGGGTTIDASVIVDMNSVSGTYRDVVGVNRPPRGTDGQGLGANTYDLAALFQSFGISTVRTQDALFDVCEVFTDDQLINAATSATLTNCVNAQGTHGIWSAKNGGANVNNAAFYNFNTVNTNLESIYNSGAGLFLRLGESNNGPNDTTDYSNWAAVALNLYKHVSGVGGGFGVSPTHVVAPLYIEIHNEPDASFWMGTKSNFYSLYNTVYDAVNAVAPGTVKIGGAGMSNTFEQHTAYSNNVASSFVSGTTVGRLDFFSAHVYGSCDTATLGEVVSHTGYLRSYMNANGLNAKPLVISEWNIGVDCSTEDSFHSQRAQSFNSSVMALMQDSSWNVEKAMYYSSFGQMSFFTMDPSSTGVVTVHPGAWAFKAHSQLIGGSLIAAQFCDSSNNCYSGSNSYSAPLQGVAVSVSSSTRVVLSNDTANNVSTSVQLNNWSGAANPPYTIYTYPTSAVTVSAPLSVSVYTTTSGLMSSFMSTNVQTTSGNAATSGSAATLSVSVPAYSTLLIVL